MWGKRVNMIIKQKLMFVVGDDINSQPLPLYPPLNASVSVSVSTGEKYVLEM